MNSLAELELLDDCMKEFMERFAASMPQPIKLNAKKFPDPYKRRRQEEKMTDEFVNGLQKKALIATDGQHSLMAVKNEACDLYVCTTMRLSDLELLHSYLTEVIAKAQELGCDEVRDRWPRRQNLLPKDYVNLNGKWVDKKTYEDFWKIKE
jgi:carboxypeptidase C (cathepsin A)